MRRSKKKWPTKQLKTCSSPSWIIGPLNPDTLSFTLPYKTIVWSSDKTDSSWIRMTNRHEPLGTYLSVGPTLTIQISLTRSQKFGSMLPKIPFNCQVNIFIYWTCNNQVSEHEQSNQILRIFLFSSFKEQLF